MHIRLRQQLRQVASNTLGDLEPDEIDDYLDQAHTLFLDRILDPRNNKLQIGFEQSYQRFAQAGIQPTTLIRELKANGPDMMIVALPPFLHTLTRIDVSTEKCKSLYSTKTFKRVVIPFVVPHTMPDFSEFSIVVGATTITIDALNLSETYLNPEDTQTFIRQLHKKKVGNVLVEWESTDDLYVPNSLIITIPTTNGTQTATINFNGESFKSGTFETITHSVSAISTEGIYRGANIAQQEDASDMLIDPFQTTKHTRPLVEISGKYIIVHHNETFAPKYVRIGYIPIPAPVSYNLNISSEMPERTHEQIVALAAELIQQDMTNAEKQPESRN